MEEKRKGYYDLLNLLNRYKRRVTYSDLIETVCKEGWYSDFKRIGFNSIIRQINNHNRKYPGGEELPYKNN